MTLQPAPIITSRITIDPVVITADPPTAPVVTKGGARAPAVKVRPSSMVTAEAEPAKPNVT